MTFPASSTIARITLAGLLATGLAGCRSDGDVTGSIAATGASREGSTNDAREARWRAMLPTYAAAYEKNPADPRAGYAYGLALRVAGQRAQALAVLEGASVKNPRDMKLLGAYGRALADAGRLDEALAVLDRAHTPDAPDWRILNAQGAILDQLGRSQEARGHYASALKIAPGEPSILSNLGLSYALTKDIAKAEEILARAAADPKADEKVRANLAMVQRLSGSRTAAARTSVKPTAKPTAQPAAKPAA